jgi:hypothetical protein
MGKWYGRLLRLYPRGFREQFGEGMAQTYRDMCRERAGDGWGLLRLAVWVFLETFLGVVRESVMGKMVRDVALGALAVWMIPAVAAQFVADWHWGVGGFAMAYLVFFTAGMVFAVIARRMGAWTYKAGVGLAVFAGLGLAWSNMVHVAGTENPANLWYYSVLVVGMAGAALARLRAWGLAWTLFAMAAVLAVISVLLPSGAPPEMARRMAIGHGVFVVLFAVSGLLFRRAGQAQMGGPGDIPPIRYQYRGR